MEYKITVMKNAFYAQSGGVTSVINCSAYGVISKFKKVCNLILFLFDILLKLNFSLNTKLASSINPLLSITTAGISNDNLLQAT